MDSDHFGKTTADFFLKAEKPRVAMAIEDADGIALFFLTEPDDWRTTRLHIQFWEDQEHRTGKVLFRGFPIVARELYLTGCRRIVFETINPKLSGFCHRVFGFGQVNGTNDWELNLTGEFGAEAVS